MKISYLVTCSSEVETLQNLLSKLDSQTNTNDEVVIVVDNPTKETSDILTFWTGIPDINAYEHPLNNDYGAHKNYGNSLCSGDYIFQIDGDELPSEYLLGENLRAIIEANEGVELIYVPRINDFKGVTEAHAKQWGWKLSYKARPSINEKYLGPFVNWPDYQGRIYKNAPDRIKWDRKLHEKIVGHDKYSFLPAEEEYALYHDKTIEKQIETNLRYNKQFSVDDNKGHIMK